MTDILMQLGFSILTYHVQIVIALAMFAFGQAPRSRRHLSLGACLAGVLLLIPNIYRRIEGTEVWICPALYLGWYNLSYILFWTLAMLVFWFTFKTAARQVLFYGIAAYTMQNFSFNLRSIVRIAFFGNANGLANRLFGLLLGTVLYILLYYSLVRQLRLRSKADTVGNSTLILYLLIVLFVVNVFSQYWSSHSVTQDYLTTDMNGTVLSAVCGLTLLMLQFGVFERTELEREKETMNRLLSEMGRQQQATAENIDVINRKCHDLKHQIGAMRHMEEAERESSISELEKAVMIYDCEIHTGCQALDTLLTEKNLLCEQEGITLSVIADAAGLDFMAAADIYTLFGNAVDNALECVRQYSEEEKRQVSLHVGQRGNMISIRMENYCDIPLRFENDLPRTTKADQDYHGFGTRSIRYIVQKYGGELRMRQQSNAFVLDIIFIR